jgi:hypothetical protein
VGRLRTLYHLKLFSVEWDENIIVFCDVEKTGEKQVVVYFGELHSEKIKELRKITVLISQDFQCPARVPNSGPSLSE